MPIAGEVATDLYILIRGQLHVVVSDHNTKVVKVAEGTIFGEAGVVLSVQVRCACWRGICPAWTWHGT